MKKTLSVLVFCIIRLCCYSQDASGTYLPIVSSNMVNITGAGVTPSLAHYEKMGNQVFVTGQAQIVRTINGTGNRTYFVLSQPPGFPVVQSPGDFATGTLTAIQNGGPNNQPGYVTTVPNGQVLFIFNCTLVGGVNVSYHYAYTTN